MSLVLCAGLAWVDPELVRMRPPRPLLETPAYPDLAGGEKLHCVLVGMHQFFPLTVHFH